MIERDVNNAHGVESNDNDDGGNTDNDGDAAAPKKQKSTIALEPLPP